MDLPLSAWSETIGTGPVIGELKPGRVWHVAPQADSRSYVLKKVSPTLHPRPVETEDRVLIHLAAQGLPVALPIRTDDGEPGVSEAEVGAGAGDGTMFRLVRFFESDDEERDWTDVGRAIGLLHKAFASYDGEFETFEIDMAKRVFDQALPALENPELTTLCEGIGDGFEGLGSQLIHGDCHGANILTHQGKVSGLIDLDHLPIGPRTYDLGYFLANSAKHWLKSNGRADPHLLAFDRFAGDVLTGYRSVEELTDRELASIEPMMLGTMLTLAQWYVRAGLDASPFLNTIDWLASPA